MAMKKLSVELQSILSSSLQINSFKRVVEELVYNSLDAKATSIAIRADIAENKIQVVDNGCGITENDFDLIGEKYSTSKCVDLNTLKSVPNTYGFRGQFLANLINIAQKVKITSRFGNSNDTWVKIFYDGKERDLTKAATRPSVGTTVEVSGIFYNLHIKSKNMEPINELNEIKMLLKQLSLIHSNISISLRNDSKNEIVFKAHKNRDVYQTFGMLFNIDEHDIQEFKVEKKEYKVTAYFAKKDKDIGQYHWIYLNGKYISYCKLHKIVNEALSKSMRPTLKRNVKTKVDNNEDVLTKTNVPFYVMLLSCPYYDYDINDLSNHAMLEFRNWQDITNLLKKLILFYTGDDTCNKKLNEKSSKNDIKSKITEDDTRDQVRKIVEKLLKSNSKKLGVSQMQNGVKGKLTKRKKKKIDHSLKLSLSKVIPSKNKLIQQQQLYKDLSKKTELSHEIQCDLQREVTSNKHLQKEKPRIKNCRNKSCQTTLNRSLDIKARYESKGKRDNFKYQERNLNDVDRKINIFISRTKSNIRSNSIIQNNNDDRIYDLKHQVKPIKYLQKENNHKEDCGNKTYQTAEEFKTTRGSEIEVRNKRRRRQEIFKYQNTILNDADQRNYIAISNKKYNTFIQNYHDEHIDENKYQKGKINMENHSNCDFNECIDINEYKNNFELNNSTRNNTHKFGTNTHDRFYRNQNVIKDNDITTTYNFNNRKITLREKVEEIIVYDYVPHPLNSNHCYELHESKFKKMQPVSSRDLVKTILNTQQISNYENINVSLKDKYKAQQTNRDVLATSVEVKRHKTENVVKTTRSSTFDAWNLNFQSDSHFTNEYNNEGMFLTTTTYESHHYNISNDKTHNTAINRTQQRFITTQAKDNFILSTKKQKNNLRKNYKPKATKKSKFNLSLGIKNFFKTNNLMPESSLKIEFSNSTDNNILRETKYQRLDESTLHENVEKWSFNSRTNQDPIDRDREDLINSYNKNTYTICEPYSDAEYNCNIRSQNFECISCYTLTNNCMHETYTIETNNKDYAYSYTNKNDKDREDKVKEKQNGLNIVFISEPRVEVDETLSDKKSIEPLNVCETVLSNSLSHNKSNVSFESLTHMENILNDINRDNVELADKQKNSTLTLQEVSRHFNNTINNTNNIKAAKKSLISNKDFNIQNNPTNFPTTIDYFEKNKSTSRKINHDTNQNLHNDAIVINYSIKNRPRFMPKGMSQIFENCNTKDVCDYNLNEEYFKYKIYEDFTDKVQTNTEIFKPKIQSATEDNTKAIEKVHAKLHKEKSSLIFDGKLLKLANVLGQVDDKFIAAILKTKTETSDFIVLFDQHAVHERIRLEKNMAEYFNQHEWKRVNLDDFILKLSKDEILYLHNYKDKFSQLGLEWNILNDCEVSIFGIPEAILGKNPRQADKVIAAVKNLILEEISTINSQRGCISLHPRSIMDLVFSEACRYAIKFGDKLTIAECKELIQSLSECKTPFQCAHGRPVMAVLLEMSSHYVREYKVDMLKIRSFSINKPK